MTIASPQEESPLTVAVTAELTTPRPSSCATFVRNGFAILVAELPARISFII